MTLSARLAPWLLPVLWVALAVATLLFVLSEPTVVTVSAAVAAWCGGVVTVLIGMPLVSQKRA